jgi:hypothetical protein
MTEWTEVPGVRLIHGDCLDVMPTLDAGSGSTAEACLATGMRCVVVDREAEYVEDCRRRVQEDAAETPLFAP